MSGGMAIHGQLGLGVLLGSDGLMSFQYRAQQQAVDALQQYDIAAYQNRLSTLASQYRPPLSDEDQRFVDAVKRKMAILEQQLAEEDGQP